MTNPTELDAAVVSELRAYAEYVIREDCGTVSENGTVWANVPISGPGSIFEIAAAVVAAEESSR